MEKGAKVKYRGIQVGKVTDISYSGKLPQASLLSTAARFILQRDGAHRRNILAPNRREFIRQRRRRPSRYPECARGDLQVQLEVNTFQRSSTCYTRSIRLKRSATLSAPSSCLRGHGDDLRVVGTEHAGTREPKAPPFQ